MIPLLAEVNALLSISTLTLATAGPSQPDVTSLHTAPPHAAAVYFTADLPVRDSLRGLRLYFFSDPTSQHGQDLHANPQAAAAIYPAVSGWQEIRGLQLHGAAHILPPGSTWEAAWQLYQIKFPFVSGLKAILQRNALYEFIPSWLRLVDNRRGFGFKQEWELADLHGS